MQDLEIEMATPVEKELLFCQPCFTISKGVPQGSILDPYLCIFYL